MLLSILIPTLRERTALREPLLAHLHGQAAPYLDVEILMLEDDRRVPFHRKLNNLVDIAAGEYIVFVDDDDWVADDYVDSIVAALHRTPGCDAVCFDSLWTLDGRTPTRVRFGPRYPVEGTPGTEFRRPIQHIQVVRADIARQVRYTPPDHGCDTLWAAAVRDRGLIRTVVDPIRRCSDQYMYEHRATADDRDGLWQK